MALQNGAVVWLKSGGPAMTVKHQDSNGDMICTWFTYDDEIMEHNFSAEQLTEEDPNEYYDEYEEYDDYEEAE